MGGRGEGEGEGRGGEGRKNIMSKEYIYNASKHHSVDLIDSAGKEIVSGTRSFCNCVSANLDDHAFRHYWCLTIYPQGVEA